MAFIIPDPLPISCTDCHRAMRIEHQWPYIAGDQLFVAAECACGRVMGMVDGIRIAAHRGGRLALTRADIKPEGGDAIGDYAKEGIARAREHISDMERLIAAATWANGGRKP